MDCYYIIKYYYPGTSGKPPVLHWVEPELLCGTEWFLIMGAEVLVPLHTPKFLWVTAFVLSSRCTHSGFP